MHNGARVLQFRSRAQNSLLPAYVAEERARELLSTPPEARDPKVVDNCLSQPDVLLAVIDLLRRNREVSPSSVAAEAERIYFWLKEWSESVGLFDERAYFSGESALLVGNCSRLTGKRREADLWLDRAEAAFRRTINATPQLANVTYVRLGLKYDKGQYDHVLEFLPALRSEFEQAGMKTEVLKCKFFEAVTLRACARQQSAKDLLVELKDDPGFVDDRALKGRVLVTLGEIEASDGRTAESLRLYAEALNFLEGQPIAKARLKTAMGETLRDQGLLNEAAEAYRASIREYESLEMRTWAAYVRVVLSETLIAADRHREAEWEILAALPTIEEQKMVPEGFAAVALLKESVRRRKTDPNALRVLREHLQTSK